MAAAYMRHTNTRDDDDEGDERGATHGEHKSGGGGIDGGRRSSGIAEPAFGREPRSSEQEEEDDDDLSGASSSLGWLESARRSWRLQVASSRLYLRQLWTGEKLAVQYLVSDTRREAKGVAIGVFTVLLVVMLVALLENNVQRSPLIFWRIAETTVGENDLVLTSGFGVGGVTSLSGESSGGGLTDILVQQRFVDDRLRGLDKVQGSTGRWLFFARVLPAPPTPPGNTSSASPSAATPAAARPTNSSYVPPATATSAAAYLLGLNSLEEASIGLGRSWSHPPLVGEEVYLTRSVVRQIGLDPESCIGSTVILRLDLLDVATTLQVGGLGSGGGSDGADDGLALNTTATGPPPSEAQQAAQQAAEDDNTPEQNKAIVIKILIEKAVPSMTNMWSQPVQLGKNAALIIAFVELLNATVASAASSAAGAASGASGGLPLPPLPLPLPLPSVPPEQLDPLLAILQAQYNVTLSPEQLQQLLDSMLSGATVVPPGAALPGSDAFVLDTATVSGLLLDPALLSWDLARLRNGSETYEDLLELFTPFLLQLLRVDTTFTIKGVVDEPDGKWALALGSVVVLENGELMRLLSNSIERVMNLQSRINMSAPLVPPGTAVPSIPPIPGGVPGGGGGGIPGIPGVPVIPSPPVVPEQATWPLERILDLFLPRANSTAALHKGFEVLDSAAVSLRSGNFSLMGLVQYEGRLKVYLKVLADMNRDLMHWTNIVSAQGVGFDYPVTFTLPLAVAMQLTIYIRYFLDNIFSSVIFLLVLLGMLLIYSLLLADADAKTFEYGMLRALGMRHQTLVQILLTKSLMFSVPGIGIGLFLAFLANIPLARKIASFAVVSPEYSFLLSPVLLGVCLGLAMPLVANLVPISRALAKTLRDSLDVYHVVVSEVTVRVVKLQEMGIDLWQSSISVLLIVVGFATFYVIPYAFTFNKIPLFLAILNAILLGMLLGLCIVASLVQPLLERAVLACLLGVVRPHRKLLGVVTKNLAAHSGRNGKTSQMFLICLSFLVFAGVMFNLQSASLSDNLKVFAGADIQIFSPLRDPAQHLKETEMRAYLDQIKQSGGIVEDFTFVTYPLNRLLPVDTVGFSSLPQFPVIRNLVWGVEAHYLDVAYSEFFHATDTNTAGVAAGDIPRTRQGDVDAVRLMVQGAGRAVLPEELQKGARIPPSDVAAAPTGITVAGGVNQTTVTARLSSEYHSYLDVLVSESLRGAASVSILTPLHLSVLSWNENTWIASDYLCKARAMVIKLPGFFFSSYRQTARLSSVVIPMEQYKRVMKDVYYQYAVPATPPKQKLLIRLREGASRNQREDLINGLRTFFRNDKTQTIDTQSLIGTMDNAVALMNLFFTLVGAIAMVMCFFLLWLSFTANVEENAFEFGVLRAIGLNSVEVVMIYVYESLALVFASVILGTGIGLMIAATLTLQFGLFTELPFRMEFPVPLFVTMLVMAFVVAIVGSALPAYGFLRKTISAVLRRQ